MENPPFWPTDTRGLLKEVGAVDIVGLGFSLRRKWSLKPIFRRCGRYRAFCKLDGRSRPVLKFSNRRENRCKYLLMKKNSIFNREDGLI